MNNERSNKLYQFTLHCYPAYTGMGKQMNMGGGGGGGRGLTEHSRGYEIMLPLNIFNFFYFSLLVRFIMTVDDKYKTR